MHEAQSHHWRGSAGALELEITETGLMQDMELTFQTLLDIRKSRRVDID